MRICIFVLMVLCCLPAEGWQARDADLAEAFLLWATPRAEYSGKSQEDAYAMLMTDSMAAAMVLPRFLNSPSGSIRDKVLTLCENIGPAAVGPAFRPHAGSDSPHLGIVMYCLSRGRDTESLPILLMHLTHPRAQMRATAALSLGYLGMKEAVGDLIDRLKIDTSVAVRRASAFAIGRCVDSSTVTPPALAALTAALDDEHFSVRFNAARALAELSVPAHNQLLARYDTLSDTARYGALTAIGRIALPESRRFLETVGADTSASMPLRGVALKWMLDQKWTPAEDALADLRATSVGRGLFGLLR